MTLRINHSLVFALHFGQFDALFGGDLSGYKTSTYTDNESILSNRVSQVELYKVHHHASKNNSNPILLSAIKPMVGIISCGTSIHTHPDREALDRLLTPITGRKMDLYRTELGNGCAPFDPAHDRVSGNILVTVPLGGNTFTVQSTNTPPVSYQVWKN